MHILAQKKGKISFGLSRKNPKFEKYTEFKPHFIHSIAHVTAKMKCDAVMILAKLKTTLHGYTAHMTAKTRCDTIIVLAKPYRKMR